MGTGCTVWNFEGLEKAAFQYLIYLYLNKKLLNTSGSYGT